MECFVGIYRGYFPAMAGSFPGQCIYYPVYEWTHVKLLGMLSKTSMNTSFQGINQPR
jgi:hypothetical protein